ncbi:heterokaryon incompatibility protein-domain-containing protein [Massariosphaeria phaeospora]|uniref:Heterokaryon incompatibility protein-domain-containing protein n=1 Tax=Massariosphaeria phaeospora TaxID=100035 RepID=A0A7C8I714_9PLEO|nr:heterokaryon incompatibility protein-domain-containing protein [Massariosphaeria phaeospora]
MDPPLPPNPTLVSSIEDAIYEEYLPLPDDPESTLPPYEYAAIDAENETRVLILQPAEQFTDALQVELLHRAIAPAIAHYENANLLAYDAVSYCWGASDFFYGLECQRTALKFTHNVDSMLRHFRKRTRALCLWIDAVCINQSDNEEKAQQARRMGPIYARAEKVRVWIGDAKEKDRLPEMAALCRELAVFKKRLQKERWDVRAFCNERNAKEYLDNFLSCPWFRRRWIVQEVLLAHHLTVYCGAIKIPWTQFMSTVKVMGTKELFQPSLSRNAMQSIQNILAFAIQPSSLIELLELYHKTECSDPRDKILSLTGLADQCEDTSPRVTNVLCDIQLDSPIFKIDYDADWVSTYTNFARACANSGSGLEVLNHILYFGSLRYRNTQSPSWITDWSGNKVYHESLPKYSSWYDPISTEHDDISDNHYHCVDVAEQLGLRIPGIIYNPVQCIPAQEEDWRKGHFEC